MPKVVVVPLGVHNRKAPRTTHKRGIRTTAPVRLDAIDTQDGAPPTLRFKRKHPKCTWLVPPMMVPLYWFDIVMLRKKLITCVTSSVFIADGRRFKVLAQDQKVIGIGYTRWLVYEEHWLLPNKGTP